MGCWPLACFHSPGTPITFDPNPMAETVGERVAVSRVVNDLPRCDVDAGSRRVLAHLVDGLSLGFEHYIPHLGPVRRSMTVKAVKTCLEFLFYLRRRDSIGRLLQERREECPADIRRVAVQVCTGIVSDHQCSTSNPNAPNIDQNQGHWLEDCRAICSAVRVGGVLIWRYQDRA
jgi:hypothetical protein